MAVLFHFTVGSGSCHVVFCVTCGDEPKFMSILLIPQTPKGRVLCVPSLVWRNHAGLAGKCCSSPLQNRAISRGL